MASSDGVSPVVEEYLEYVYRLEEKMGFARTTDMVKFLGVVPGTVTNTVEWLEKKDLVTHRPYRGVKLTKKGREIALQVIRRHRLSERLLTDILHMEWGKVHEEACRLEHSMTEEVITPLEEALNHPKTCPHGNPIPSRSGGVVEEETRPLLDLEEGEESVIARITEERADLLQYIGGLGLLPGVRVRLVKKAPLEGPITIGVGSESHALSPAVASVIRVRVCD